MWIWENSNWPSFTWDMEKVDGKLNSFGKAKARLEALLAVIPHDAKTLLSIMNLSSDIYFSSKMEGVDIEDKAIHAAISRAFGFEEKARSEEYENDLASLMADSMNTSPYDIDSERILEWHSLLLRNLKGSKVRTIGSYRKHPVYVVQSTGMFTSKVLYEAVPYSNVRKDMEKLLRFMGDESIESIIRTAISAIWLPLIHPFEDGNGRISRIFSDAFLFAELGCRPTSISTAIYWKRHEYYELLSRYNKADNLDITEWICWYIELISEEFDEASAMLTARLTLQNKIMNLDPAVYNSREIFMLSKLASGSIQERLTAEKWSKLTGCKSATATRDLAHLVEKGILIRSEEGGRTTSYLLYRDTI